jgi:hypothetical protein
LSFCIAECHARSLHRNDNVCYNVTILLAIIQEPDGRCTALILFFSRRFPQP